MRNKKLFQETKAADYEFRVLADDELDFVSGGTDSLEVEEASEETQEVQSDSSDFNSDEKKLADLASQAVAESAPVETSADNTSAETQVEAPSESAYIEIQADNTSAEDVIEISGENSNIEPTGDASEDSIVVEGSVGTTYVEALIEGSSTETQVETPTEDASTQTQTEVQSNSTITDPSNSGFTVHHNAATADTLNQLSRNQGTLEKSLEKLSSGMKINSAADDPSGYQIAERMRVQVRSLDQANYNAQNGRSMMKVEEGAVDSTVETLRTLKEKVINAVNDTNTEVDRESIQKEINESIQQIDDNALLTFNGKFLNNGSRTVNGETTRNVLYTEQQNSDISNELSIMNSVLKERNGNNLDISATDMVEVSYVVNGITYKTEFPAEDLANAMKQVREEQGSVADNLSVEAGETHGTSEPEVINTNDNGESIYFTAPANDIVDSLTSISNGLADKNSEMKSKVNSIIDSFEEEISARNESEDNSVAIQIGANANQRMNLSLEDMRSAALGLSGNGRTVSVSDKTNATAALKVIDNALQRALNQEASIGAVMNRLEFTSNNLTTSSENLQSAESTYRDADMAKEMTEFTKNNILMQAATAMLSQANQQNQGVLSLL